MNIGLTGGIACGKSTVSKMLVERGAILIDADTIAREVVLPGSPVLAQVAEQFGSSVLAEDGSLLRKKLGEIIFQDDTARKKLEAILHPPIRARMKEKMQQLELQFPDKLIVVDIPLLYESQQQHLFSEIVVVYAPKDTQITRLMERDHISEEQAQLRLQAQMPIEEKKQLATVVIDNSGELAETEKQVVALLNRMGLA